MQDYFNLQPELPKLWYDNPNIKYFVEAALILSGVASEAKNDAKDKCKRCGKCCYLTFVFNNGDIMNTKTRCQFLTKNNLCSVYDNRPSWCLSVDEMIERNLLPSGCGYRKENL